MKDIETNSEYKDIDSSSKKDSALSKPTIQNPEFLIITPDNRARNSKRKVFIIPIIVTALLIISFTLFIIFSSALKINSPFVNTLDKFLSSINTEDVSENQQLLLNTTLDNINEKLNTNGLNYEDLLKKKNEEYINLCGSNWYKEISFKEVLTLSTNDKKFINVLDKNNKILDVYQVVKIDNDYKVNFEF